MAHSFTFHPAVKNISHSASPRVLFQNRNISNRVRSPRVPSDTRLRRTSASSPLKTKTPPCRRMEHKTRTKAGWVKRPKAFTLPSSAKAGGLQSVFGVRIPFNMCWIINPCLVAQGRILLVIIFDFLRFMSDDGNRNRRRNRTRLLRRQTSLQVFARR